MKSFTLVSLALLVAMATASYCSSGSSFGDDCQSRKDDCSSLLSGGKTSSSESSSSDSSSSDSSSSDDSDDSDYSADVSSGNSLEASTNSGSGSDESSGDEEESGSGSGSGSASGSGSSSGVGSGLLPYDDYCLLLQYFYNISIEITDVTIYNAWIVFINECQYNIIYDQSITVEEKLVAIFSELQLWLVEYSEVSELIENIYISEWEGYVFDLQSTIVLIQYQYTQSIIELDASGSCALFEALLNGTAYDAELYAQVEILIQQITVILQSSSYSYSYQLVLIYQQFESFFAEYSSYEEIILAINIEGYGLVESFFEVVTTYWQVYSYDVVVGGSVSDCAIIQVLTEAYQNESFGSASQRAQIKQLVNSLTTYFEDNESVDLRVQYFFSTFYQFIILQEWSVTLIFSIEIDGYGTIYDFIAAYSFAQDCGCVDFAAPTTTALPTTALPTSTVAPGDCSKDIDVLAFSDNTTDLSYSIDQAQVNWNSSLVTQFSPYEKRIWVVSKNSTATREEVLTNVVKIFNGWSTNTANLEVVYSVQITIYHGTSQSYVWGTIQDLCDCA